MRAAPIPIEWNSNLSIFASESFLKAVSDAYGWLGGFDDRDNLRCILPYTIIRMAFIRMVRFRVETIPVGEGLEVQEEKAFLNSAMAFFRSNGAGLVIPATTNTIFRTYPDGAVAAPYGTYIMDLTQSEKVLWGQLSSSHRRKVRQAMKQNVQVRAGNEYTTTAYEMVRDTFKRSKLGFMGFDAFKRYVAGLGEHVKILVAEHQGVIQGCMVVPFSDHSAYYVYGGSIPEPVVGATNLLHWEAMTLFRAQGVKRYDFVGVRIDPEKGSKQEGLQTYKQRFGGRLVQGYMWKYALRPLKFGIYSLAVKYMRGGDIVDTESHKLGKPPQCAAEQMLGERQ